MNSQDSVSLVLPCRNQADHIGAVLERYLAALAALAVPFELVVVPNACSDDTPQIVDEWAARDPRVRVAHNALGGWGLSVRCGLEASRGAVLAYTNTARTDPEVVPKFVRRFWEQGGNCLIKARREARQAPLRQVGSWVYNLEARLCFGIRCGDVNGTPKVFSREAYRAVPLMSKGDLLDLELLAGVARRQIPVVEIPLRGFRRHGGKSSTNWKSALGMYGGALRLWAGRAELAA